MTHKNGVVTQAQKKTLFPGQSDHEEIVIFIRRHWIPFALWILLILIMLFIPILLVIWFAITNSSSVLEGKNLVLISLGVGTYLLFVEAIFLTAWIEQYLDVAIITTNRLVHIRQIGLFNRRVAELGLDRVQDVSAHMHGYLQSVMQFGTVVVETASGAPDFVIHNVSKPHVVANTILMIHDRLRENEAKDRIEGQEEKTILPSPSSGTIQEAIVENVPSIAPPPDYKPKHLQEDLLMQAIKVSDQREANDQEEKKLAVPVPATPPNRLPPKNQGDKKGEGELVEGEVVSIQPD